MHGTATAARPSCGQLRVRPVAVGLLSLAVWYFLLMRFGTFMPPFVWTHTTAHVRRGPTTLDGDWRPPRGTRVVLSLTTLPHHVPLLKDTLASLKAQTLVPARIHVNIPRGTNKRTGAEYAIPTWLHHEPGVYVNRCEEYGPLTKLLPTLQLETDPETVIITVDDDKTYPPDLVRTLAWHTTMDSRVAFGLCGWSFLKVPTARGVVPVYVPWALRGEYGRVVDVLQAVCGNAYRRKHFADLPPAPPACYTTDDIYIASYLRTRGVHSVVIPHARHLEPVDPPWKQHESPSAVAFRLSSYNLDAYSDLKCMQASEAWA